MLNSTSRHTDVLNCFANFSSDEVPTPPEIANKMLDLLPQDLFKNPNAKFLDPACKSGVFLREITKRLNEGLKDIIPNQQERIDHILHKQIYGIGITDLCALISRRSVYCCKDASSKYSISHFDKPEGNIIFNEIQHTWDKEGKCIYCGAPKKLFNVADNKELHAYEFIHRKVKEIQGMKFDVIVSNPPYQLNDGGAQASATPLYNKFIDFSKSLSPSYISMIIPSRWMTSGKGLDTFRKNMLDDDSIRELHDFADSKMCFSGVDIKGGVCYFLRDNKYHGDCKCVRYGINGKTESVRPLREDGNNIFIREPILVSILKKVKVYNEKSFSNIVSARKPYGLASEVMRNATKFNLPEFSDTEIINGYRVFGLGENQKRMWKWIPNNYPIPKIDDGLMKYKVFIAEAYGCAEIGGVLSTPVLSIPVLSVPGELCTETFLQIGPFNTKEEANNVLFYIKTKFFRALVGIKKQTQHTTQKVYEFVPMQDFSKLWTDEELYKKYNLTQDEISFIETMIKPME